MANLSRRVAAGADDALSYPTSQFETDEGECYIGNDVDWNNNGF